MSVVASVGGEVTLAFTDGEEGQVHVAARTQRGAQDILVRGWFDRDALEDALTESRNKDRTIMVEPAA